MFKTLVLALLLAVSNTACNNTLPTSPTPRNAGSVIQRQVVPDLEALRESVVRVKVSNGHGTGFVIRRGDGFFEVLTAHHVVEEEGGLIAKSVEVIDRHGLNLIGVVSAYSSEVDLALITVTIDDSKPLAYKTFPAVKLSDKAPQAIGATVFAMGFPRDVPGVHITVGWVVHVSYDDIVTTASGWYGNSGGPVFNQSGEVVGVMTNLTWNRETGDWTNEAIRSVSLQQIQNFLVKR